MFNIRSGFGSLLRSLVIFLWPEICCRNLTFVYINEPTLKSASLYAILLKVTVSKNLLTTLVRTNRATVSQTGNPEAKHSALRTRPV